MCDRERWPYSVRACEVPFPALPEFCVCSTSQSWSPHLRIESSTLVQLAHALAQVGRGYRYVLEWAKVARLVDFRNRLYQDCWHQDSVRHLCHKAFRLH